MRISVERWQKLLPAITADMSEEECQLSITDNGHELAGPRGCGMTDYATVTVAKARHLVKVCAKSKAYSKQLDMDDAEFTAWFNKAVPIANVKIARKRA